MPKMSKSPSTTEERLPNPYPAEGLREDLLDALGVSVADVAKATGLPAAGIDAVLDGTRRVDAEFDLRFTRYFGFTPGYLLRLQVACDLAEARITVGSDLDRIRPLPSVAA